ncbi:expressed unknown protein [Seminavis robusta]|uniref:HMA domain-containing protein n=1 Tax=Seminavis robusta TaxID=568900 RepID=A0A9N8DTH6_9STRA|nr:expressed unknown protein [Seminavis robusta]|eukprot:Sro330_g118990.1 n/a (335) ;mRNA; f:61237-62241
MTRRRLEETRNMRTTRRVLMWQILLVLSVVAPAHCFSLPRSNSPWKGSIPESTILPPPQPLPSGSRLFSTKKDEEKPPSSSSLAKYHLIWSPRVWQGLILSSVSLWLTLRQVPIPNLRPNSVWLQTLLLPTLSSACCWIQILLNATTALGCAQFNTYLGPIRPFFLSLLAYLTVVTRHQVTPASMVLRWTIALLPEFLHLWNTRLRLWFWRPQSTTSTTTSSSSAQKDASKTTSNKKVDVAVYLDCPTMGCVACVQNVNQSLQKALSDTRDIQQIQTVDSWLFEGNRKGGKAKVKFAMNDKEDPEKILPLLTKALKRAGFRCSVDVVRTTTPVG